MGDGQSSTERLDGVALSPVSRDAMSAMRVLAWVLLGLAGTALVVRLFGPRFAPAAVTTVLVVMLTFGGMILGVVLIMERAAVQTDRLFVAFCQSEMLADWRFPAAEWERFIDADASQIGRVTYAIALCVVLPLAGIAGVALWTGISGWVRIAGLVAVVMAVAGTFYGVMWFERSYAARRMRQQRRSKRVLIGHDSVYCGGRFWRWNVNLLVLQKAKLRAGTPMLMDLTLGSSPALQVVGGLLAVAALVGGGSAGGGTVSQTVLIPVPAGREDEAARVVAALLSPAAG
jgi:hypothetical protein